MKRKVIYSFTVLLLSMQSAAALTQKLSYENLTALTLHAENFIKNSHLNSKYPVIIDIKPISKRMKLRQCEQTVKIEYNHPNKQSGRTLLKLSCAAPVKWKLHLPVTIDLFEDVLVLKNPVLRSQSIDENDITVKKMNQRHLLKGFYTHVDQLRLLQSKRNLTRNTVLSPSNLKPKRLITSGQQVTLVLDYSGIAIKVSGTALQSASKGQRIKVRNNSSLKTVEGIVSASGTVQVQL